ncbi:MAG: HD domain-containing protein [Desulfurivibrionaceae bacterium]|nr:HD domain-containing protein [Desulfurivibrionaceae bacterium]
MGFHDGQLPESSLFIEEVAKIYGRSDCHCIRQAMDFAQAAPKEHFPTLIKVPQLLVEQKADAPVVISSLLAPLLWDHSLSLARIRTQFGKEIAALLEHFTLPPVSRTDTRGHRHHDTHRLLTSLGQDIRKTILVLAFRAIALESRQQEEGGDIAREAEETLHYLVPIARRLNLGVLRRRLEDAAFRVLNPGIYEVLERQVAPIRAEDAACLEILQEATRRLLVKNGIKGQVEGRIKSLYSIHCKMMRKGAGLDQILDRIGLRIIVDTVPECYTVLGLLHSHFQPVPGGFDDYIGLPKDNGYQSLHTCVYPVRDISHKPIEFQIRTQLMHKEAEYGVAAHWRYKEELPPKAAGARQKSQWLKGLVGHHHETTTPEEFIQLLSQQVYAEHIVIFGQGGQIMRLGQNATVNHYLQKANPALSPQAVIKVNGQAVDRDHLLHDGDSIEIIEPGGPWKNGQPLDLGQGSW